MHTLTVTASETAGLKRVSLRALVGSSDVRLASGPKLALIAVARCHDDRAGRSTCSLKTIAVMSGVGEKQAARNVEALVALGLVRRMPRQGRSTAYLIDLAALAAFETCRRNADQPAEPRTWVSGVGCGTLDIGDAAPGHLEPLPQTFATLTPDTHVHRTERVLKSTEGGTEARAPEADQVVAAFPPLPDFEDLKTEPPRTAVDYVLACIADKRAEQLPIGGSDLRRLIEAAAASGELPLAVAADAVRGCLPATPPAMPAIDPAKQARLNARRQAAGKPVLAQRDWLYLAAEAQKAGRTLDSLLDLMEARGWLFARADWKGVRQEAAPVPARPDELTASALAAAAIRSAAISTGPVASPETRARYAAQLAVQRAAIAARALAAPPAAVAGLELTGQPGWVVENVRKLRAGLPVGHMARTR
ncbi:hypothetical protein, partial [Malikia spinosa]|uniref:hypothetical protein n=1 Tax=Malikia spinosa TaxID=86180 RepID=UPI0027B931E4